MRRYHTSLSARRAWIEILSGMPHGGSTGVALRKESVDRNNGAVEEIQGSTTSLSARRAWIEIARPPFLPAWPTASLSARRAWIEIP